MKITPSTRNGDSGSETKIAVTLGMSCPILSEPQILRKRSPIIDRSGIAHDFTAGVQTADTTGAYDGILADRAANEAPLSHPRAQVANQHERLRLARLSPRRPRGELDRIAVPQDANLTGDFPA